MSVSWGVTDPKPARRLSRRERELIAALRRLALSCDSIQAVKLEALGRHAGCFLVPAVEMELLADEVALAYAALEDEG